MELCSDHYQNTNVTAPRSSKAHVLQLHADSNSRELMVQSPHTALLMPHPNRQ
jgi:hypothetical protein